MRLIAVTAAWVLSAGLAQAELPESLRAFNQVRVQVVPFGEVDCEPRHEPRRGRVCYVSTAAQWLEFVYEQPSERIRAPQWAFTEHIQIEAEFECCYERGRLKAL